MTLSFLRLREGSFKILKILSCDMVSVNEVTPKTVRGNALKDGTVLWHSTVHSWRGGGGYNKIKEFQRTPAFPHELGRYF